MLISLNISNFAVFEKQSINFDSGFNVFTGETGSGKSVLIQAISLILGERASKDLIRKGKSSALIEAVFDIAENSDFSDFLNSNNIEINYEDYLIISREIFENGKSINKINERTVPLNLIKEAANYLLDIYGQFGHESLFKKENHILLLDSLMKDLTAIKAEYHKIYTEYNKIIKEIDNLRSNLNNKDLKTEQLQYEINEIDEANLNEFEEENLLKEIKKLSNIQEIQSSLYEITNILDNNNINNVYNLFNKIKNYDDTILDYLSKLDILLEEIHYFNHDVKEYSQRLDFDGEQLNLIEDRMSYINRLKRKYGFTVEKINEYREAAQNELNVLLESETNLNILLDQERVLKKEMVKYTDIITAKRMEAKKRLESEIINELNDLNMKNIKFNVQIRKKENYLPSGADDVEFLIATNVGSDLNAVQKVISGGEASRIMLAFKKIGCDTENAQTIIFDEIDAGISGKTAQMAGIKMKYISLKHQIICVTHSPQIASISKNHFLIEKKVVENNTYSTVAKLNDENKIYEIARLLSGMKITEKSLNNAKELIESSHTL